MENLRNRTDIKLVRPDEERKIRKLVVHGEAAVCRKKRAGGSAGGGAHAQKPSAPEQASLHGHDDPGKQQNPDVRFLLQFPDEGVRQALRVAVHGHGQSAPGYRDGGRLRGHGRASPALRHERLPRGPPAAFRANTKKSLEK